jgi:hypothetical protein
MADSFTPDQIENMNRFFEIINSSVSPLSRLQNEEEAAAVSARRASDSMENLSKTIRTVLGDSIASFSKAATNGEAGLAKYGESVESVTSSVGNMVSGLGKFYFVIGGLIKAIGIFTTSALEQNDNLMKAYSGLSDAGVVITEGLDGVRDRLNEVGLASGDYEKLLEVLRPVTATLASFGGSVNNGADAMISVLSRFTGLDNELELSLNRIGLTAADIRQGVTDYVMYQTRLGKAQGKTTEELTKGAHAYLIEMKGLQQLTGMTREEQQRERDAIMQDVRFRMKMAQMGKEGENMLSFVTQYKSQFGPEAAKGLIDRLMNMGAITTEAAGESVMRFNGEYEGALDAAKKGPESFAIIMDQIVQNGLKASKPLESVIMMSEDGARAFGMNNRYLIGLEEARNKGIGNFNATLAELDDKTKKQGDRQDDNLRSDQVTRANALLKDKALAYAGGSVVDVFNTLNRVIGAFNRMLAKAIDYITAKSGFMTPTNLSAAFPDDSEEAKKKAKEEGGYITKHKEFGKSRLRGADLSLTNKDDTEYKNSLLEKLRNNFGGQFAERTGGGDTDVALLELALKIKQRLPNFVITALNDVYHQEKKPNSKHRIGKALDFALGYTPSEEEAQAIMKMLKDMGATSVINEYPKGKGHFHVEISDAGANPAEIIGKNSSTYPKGDVSDYVASGNSTEQIREMVTQLLDPNRSSGSAGSSIADAFATFNDKLDTLIAEQRTTNSIQNDILTYTRA